MVPRATGPTPHVDGRCARRAGDAGGRQGRVQGARPRRRPRRGDRRRRDAGRTGDDPRDPRDGPRRRRTRCGDEHARPHGQRAGIEPPRRPRGPARRRRPPPRCRDVRVLVAGGVPARERSRTASRCPPSTASRAGSGTAWSCSACRRGCSPTAWPRTSRRSAACCTWRSPGAATASRCSPTASRRSTFLDELAGTAPHLPARPARAATSGEPRPTPSRDANAKGAEPALTGAAAAAEVALAGVADATGQGRRGAGVHRVQRPHAAGHRHRQADHRRALVQCDGIGPTKLERYGDEIIDVLSAV